MFLWKIILIMIGLLFLFGAQSKNNEEIVGLGGIAKLRAIATKAQLDHELALLRLRQLPHHLLLASNPLESLNSSESISTELTPSESTLLYPTVSPQTSPRYSDFTLEPSLFQLKPTQLTLLGTSESIPFAINSSELQSTSPLVNSSVEATTNYIQYDNSTTTLVMNQRKAKLENSTVKASFNRNAFHDNNTLPGSIPSQTKPNWNITSLQKENSRSSFHAAHSITKSRSEKNYSMQNFSNLTDIQKLSTHLIIIKPNSIQNNSAFIKPNEPTMTIKNNRKEQFVPKIVNFERALHRPQNIPLTENRFHEMDNSFGRNSFKNETPRDDKNIHNFNTDVSTFNPAQKEQFTSKPVHFDNSLLIEGKFHERGNSFLHGNFGNETPQLQRSQYHPEEKNKFPVAENSFPRNNFENETPMEKQNQKYQSFRPTNEDLLQRRQYVSRDKQNQELFVQYLNMIQSQNNQGVIRTAENDIDPSSLNQYISNSPQITFYPIDWKSNEVCQSPVQQYELSPITYQISRENSEEDVEKPMAEKFHGLNEKMKGFQLGNYGDENGARAADPLDPRHFHSHSLEIHHSKHVRPSTYHSSHNKHKEFSSKFQSTGHSTHFSFQKDHWNESPSIFDQVDHSKHHRKNLPPFDYNEKYPSTNNFQSSTKPLDKHHWEDSSIFGHVANLHSSNNFHSSKSLNKQHQEDLSTFGYTKNFQSPAHSEDLSTFGHAEHLPSLNDFHSPNKYLDKKHRGDSSVFDHAENLPSPNNFHSSSKSLDKQGVHSTKFTPPSSHITINNQNNFISTESVNGNQNIQIAQSNDDSISHQSLRGDQPFDRSTLGSPYLLQIPRNADIRRFKRSLPLIKLFTDPNVQLDVPKTLENFGTIARNSFEDHRAPMYHVRNMIGSAKNTVLSTLKIPPQNAIVPSRYKIVDKKSEFTEKGNNNVLGKVKNDDNGNYLDNEIMSTFHKVGNIVRESVKSGQETLQHMGDVFHNGKKAVSATRYSTPRLLLPYVRTPALKINKPDKIMLITPRFADITREDQMVGTTQTDDFVKVGDIMDAVGVSNSERKDTGISRLVLQPKKSIASNRKPNFDRKLILSKRPTLQSRFGDDVLDRKHIENAKKSGYFILREDVESNEIDEISDTLANLKSMVGTKTLKDFLMYMKQKFLLEHLKDKLQRAEQGAESNENVGSGLALGNDLMKPFMGRPSKTELTNYFRKIGDSIEDDDDLGVQRASVSAINPQVYHNYFNETLKINEKVKELTEGVLPKIPNLNDDKIGDCIGDASEKTMADMKFPKKLKKPYIGKKGRKDSKYFYWN